MEPYADQTLQIVGGPVTESNPSGSYPVTTDGNGNFLLSMKPQPDSYYSSIPGTSSVAGAQSSVVAITDSPTPIRLAAKFSQDAIEYGHTDEMTGTLEYYQSAKTLKPLPSTTVTIARLSPPGEPNITAKTNAAGAFRASIPRQTSTGTWAVTMRQDRPAPARRWLPGRWPCTRPPGSSGPASSSAPPAC